MDAFLWNWYTGLVEEAGGGGPPAYSLVKGEQGKVFVSANVLLGLGLESRDCDDSMIWEGRAHFRVRAEQIEALRGRGLSHTRETLLQWLAEQVKP